ncbi:hypothetical protein Hanom_Chr17g01530621 [Helianthus anomalus]
MLLTFRLKAFWLLHVNIFVQVSVKESGFNVKTSLDNQFPLSECSPLRPISLCSVQRSHSDPVLF